MRVFLPVSLAMFAVGIARYIYTFITEGRFTNMSALMFVTSIIIFMMSLISGRDDYIQKFRPEYGAMCHQSDNTLRCWMKGVVCLLVSWCDHRIWHGLSTIYPWRRVSDRPLQRRF